MPAWMANALTPRAWRFCTWSFISAMSGVMTSATPSRMSPGTWKHTDLPPPVGRMASTSRPSSASRMISSCMGRNAS